MSPAAFDPRAFDARGFQAPPGEATPAGEPGRITVSVTVTTAVTVTLSGPAVDCITVSPTVVATCGPAVPG